jgi:hypothetical protein
MPTLQSGITVTPPPPFDPSDEPKAKEAVKPTIARIKKKTAGHFRYRAKPLIGHTSNVE